VNSTDLMLIKKDVIATTATRGWYHIKQLAEDTVKQAEREAIDEEDDTKGNNLRREAKAARKFLNSFLKSVEVMKLVEAADNTSSEEDDFYEVATN
jgi:hypothetical protein